MKCLGLLVLVAVASVAQTPVPKTVYVLAMGGGLDQHLAAWLTREHVLQVVADPKTADAILTDSLGEGFEQRLASIRPRADEDEETGVETRPAFRSANFRGTIFLVDATTRKVLWSDYEKSPRTRSAANLNRVAGRIVKRLHATYSR